ncbi:hypothetical protein GCM10025857_39200 [Alicyclobacillus contaminans]|uniref:type II toxin-antitoxin system HicA family toxin n=1 Tax=Alicyclobacillus contaminans TaxID=392016 RepID=UPI000422E94D|nr:type II toxin-antitoxin system HicA family toxin [Alicyclobacillus contaminans]GMA52563.1 hypothetical protein GCM10025857_39200 [Alicyclobacillus contaminans]
MSQLEKLFEQIRNNPKTVHFEELDKILRRIGFERRQPRGGSSHYVYTKNGKQITVPYRRPYVLEVYVKQVIDLVEGDNV